MIAREWPRLLAFWLVVVAPAGCGKKPAPPAVEIKPEPAAPTPPLLPPVPAPDLATPASPTTEPPGDAPRPATEGRPVPAPDGATLVAAAPGALACALGSADGLDVWDVRAARRAYTLPAKPERAAFSPDGKRLAVVTRTGRVAVVDVVTGDPVRTFGAGVGAPDALVFSPDGKHLAAANFDDYHVWDLGPEEPEKLFEAKVPNGGVKALAFAPDGKTLAVGAGHSLTAADAATGKPAWTILAQDGDVRSVAFSADGARVLTCAGDNDRAVRVWDAKTGKAVAVLRHGAPAAGDGGRPPGVSFAFFGPDPGTVVTGTGDGRFHLWDVTTSAELGRSPWPGGDGRVALTPDWRTFLASGSRELRVWETSAFGRAAFPPGSGATPAPPAAAAAANSFLPVVETRQLNDRYGVFLAYTPDGTSLIGLDTDGRGTVWDAKTGKESGGFAARDGAIKLPLPVAPSPDGKTIAVARRNGRISVLDLRTGESVKEIRAHEDFIRCVAWSPDGRWIASGTNDELVLSDAKTGAKVHELGRPRGLVDEIAFSPDGKWLVAGTSAGLGLVFDAASGRKRTDLKHTRSVDHVAVSRDGRYVALGSGWLTTATVYDVTIWDGATGVLLHTLRHPAAIDQLAFGTDGLLVVSTLGTLDGFTHLWDANTGRAVARFPQGHHQAVSPDGKTLAQFAFNRLDFVDLELARDPRFNAAVSNALAGGARASVDRGMVELSLWLEGPDSLAALDSLAAYPRPLSLTLTSFNGLPDGAVRAIAACRALRRLTLKSRDLTDDHLTTLAALTELEELDLSGCEQLTPPGLAAVAKFRNLRRLSLADTRADAGTISGLSALPGLRALNLANTPGGPEALAALGKLTGLEELAVGRAENNDDGYANLAGLKSLRKLGLANSDAGPDGIAHLAGLTGLEDLDLGRTRADDAALAHLGGLVRVRRLNLAGTRVTDAGFAHLSKMTNLTALDVGGLDKLTGTGLAHLRAASGLAELDLRQTGVTDAGLAGLAEWVHLKKLRLPPTIADAGLLHLGRLAALEEVNLDDLEKVKGPGLAGLKDSGIAELSLYHLKEFDAGLVGVKDWKRLKKLSLPKSVTDEGLAHVAGLTGLESLYISEGSGVTDGGLAHLGGLANLRSLSLDGSKITDAGLKHLEGLARLRFLYVNKTGVTKEARDALKKKLPELFN